MCYIYTPQSTDTCCPNVFLEADNLLSSDVLLSFPLEHVKVILLLQPPAWVRPILIMRPGKTPQQGFVKIHPIVGLGNSGHLPMFLSTYQVRNQKVRPKGQNVLMKNQFHPKYQRKYFLVFCPGSLLLQGQYKKRVYVLFARR